MATLSAQELELARRLWELVREVVRVELHAQRAQGAGELGAEFLTMTEAASLVGRSVGTITGWRKRGELRSYGEGRGVRVSRRELLDLMERSVRRRPGPAELVETQRESRSELDREADEILARHGAGGGER